MLETSIFLVKVLGAFMLVTGLSMLIKGKSLSKIVREVTKGEAMEYMIGGAFNLIIGLLIVSVHNLWQMPLYVLLITLIGWITVVKGVIHLLLPDKNLDQMIKAFDNKTWFIISGVVFVVIGVYFLYTWYAAVALA